MGEERGEREREERGKSSKVKRIIDYGSKITKFIL